MRLNRGTLVLIAALLIVIVVALFANNAQEQSVATPTPQPTDVTVRVFPDLDSTRATRLEVRDNQTGKTTVLTRDSSFLWAVTATGATVPTDDRTVDQVAVPGQLASFATLSSTQSFDNDQLESYGLDVPTHTLTLTTDDGGTYTLHIGAANLSGNRYFAIIESAPGSGAPAPTAAPTSEATAETVEVTPTATAAPTETATPTATGQPSATPTATATPIVSLSGQQTIYLVPKGVIDTLISLIASPPYTPLPTSTPTEYPTANPYSEVDQTATAGVEQTGTAVVLTLTAQVTPSATGEASFSTPEVTPPSVSTEVSPTATTEPSATPVPPTATTEPSATDAPPTATLTRTPRPSATPTETPSATARP